MIKLNQDDVFKADEVLGDPYSKDCWYAELVLNAGDADNNPEAKPRNQYIMRPDTLVHPGRRYRQSAEIYPVEINFNSSPDGSTKECVLFQIKQGTATDGSGGIVIAPHIRTGAYPLIEFHARNLMSGESYTIAQFPFTPVWHTVTQEVNLVHDGEIIITYDGQEVRQSMDCLSHDGGKFHADFGLYTGKIDACERIKMLYSSLSIIEVQA